MEKTSPGRNVAGHPAGFRRWADRWLRRGIEVGTLALVCLSPWALGSASAACQCLLYAGVGLLLGLWGLRLVLEGRVVWQKCPVALCLAGLFLGGVGQLLPLPRGVLARLSPATAQLYARLLPARPEVLPFDAARDPLRPPAGSTLSLYPYATQKQAIQLLAIFLLFIVVRHNIAPAAGLRRLSWAVLINGTLLALFGLVQFGIGPPHTLYWTYSADGAVFGPFTYPQQGAFYLDLCVGLSVGLLLGRWSRTPESSPQVRQWPEGHRKASAEPLAQRRFRLDVRFLGMILALALMLGGVVVCGSWAGLLALGGGTLVCWLLQLSRCRLLLRVGAGVAVLAVAFGAWCGWEWTAGNARNQAPNVTPAPGLLSGWSSCWRGFRDYPLWGTGLGTFPWLQAQQQGTVLEARMEEAAAPNGCVEALVEGGLFRLLLSAAVVGLVFRLGYRAFRRHADDPIGGLALGALLSFTALVLQNLTGSALHLPALAILATVLVAHLAGLGNQPPECQPDSEPVGLRLGGMAPLVGAALAVILAVVLGTDGWRGQKVQCFELAASRLSSATDRHQQIALLEAAARLAPGNAPLQLELARAHFQRFDEERRQRPASDRLAGAAQTVLLQGPAVAMGPGWVAVSLRLLSRTIPEELAKARAKHLAQQHLGPACRHLLQARDACPLWVAPHLRIAEHLDLLPQAQPRGAYLQRAKWLAPEDPAIWYACGIQELADGQPDQAWTSWRQSLERSDLYLSGILDRSAAYLSPRDLVDRVLPDRPTLLLAAALHLFPDADTTAQRRPFLERALAILQNPGGPRQVDDQHVEALAQRALGNPGLALSAYRAALAQAPGQDEWRYELAELLHEQGHFREASQQLQLLLQRQPTHARARHLLEVVNRALATKGSWLSGTTS